VTNFIDLATGMY